MLKHSLTGLILFQVHKRWLVKQTITSRNDFEQGLESSLYNNSNDNNSNNDNNNKFFD